VQNTAIGYQAGATNTSGSNNIFIGVGSNGSSATVSNTINLGNEAITTLRAQVTSITSLSDKRDKTDIVNISEGLDFLKQLRPVSFTWDTRDKAKVGIKSAGFIAQELLALQKGSNIGDNLDLVSQDNPEKLEARYNNLLPIVVKAIQELSAEKDNEMAEKDKEIAELKARIQSLEVLINKVLEAKKP
jgi:predicted nucleotidyltransferase component of viral defense system